MDVVLAHPEGYDVMPEVEEIARKNASATGGSFQKVASMGEAFQGADIVYPKSWAPFAAMEQRTKLYQAGDTAGISDLEKKLLAQNALHKDWACTEEMMKKTKDGKALYLHCLPADISGLSCPEGEVDASVFDRYLVPLYKQASFKPYVIAAMIMMSKVKDPVSALMAPPPLLLFEGYFYAEENRDCSGRKRAGQQPAGADDCRKADGKSHCGLD